jgi:hypothetical protein
MTIEELDELERQEKLAKAEQRKKILSWIAVLTPIVLIATCNYYINTHQESAIIENPEPGDYFVFKGLISTGDQPFKLKSISNDTMEFYVPKYEFVDFKSNKSESKVYELDKKGDLYEADYTMKFRKSTIDSLRRNSELGVRLSNGGSEVFLKNVFGRNRGNAVESTLEKLVGQDSVAK